MFSPLVILGIVTNIFSVVGIVITNKYITEVDGYNFMVFLSFLHFAFTCIGTRFLLMGNYFSQNYAPLEGVLPVAVGSLLSVCFMNLNLSHNSVGFYQLSKLLCIPFTLVVQYIFYNLTVSKSIQMTLIPITAGVGYATIYDISVNPVGLIFATCAIVFTALAQIFTNTYQKSLECNALQLLYHTSPYIAVGMLIMSPFFDDMRALAQYEYTPGVIFRILLSCCFALGVNISNYLVLGKTSPLTYQVLGHFKTVCILVLGFTVFNKPVDSRNVVGIVVAMAGVITFTEIKRRTSTQAVLQTSGRESESAKGSDAV